MRAGAYGLSLLTPPLNILIMRALGEGAKTQVELRREAGSPAQSTLRSHLATLEEAGLVRKRRQDAFPGTLEYELGEAGRELEFVIATVEGWLHAAPDGPIELGSEAAKSQIKALAEGWSSTMMRTLAAEPLTLTELARLIPEVSYPSLERRLSTMRLVGQLAAMPGESRGTPHKVTSWLRRSIASLSAAARWERQHCPDCVVPIDSLDVEASFLLVVPTVQLPRGISGKCRLAVALDDDPGARPGVLVEIEQGKIVSCTASPRDTAPAWAYGSSEDWLSAVIEANWSNLELGGKRRLAKELLAGLHRSLFGSS